MSKRKILKKITIQCSPLHFYCQNDETALFDWLAKIKSIDSIQGMKKQILLIFKNNTIPDKDLIDLMGVFKRYGFIDSQQLTIFMNDQNKHWFDLI